MVREDSSAIITDGLRFVLNLSDLKVLCERDQSVGGAVSNPCDIVNLLADAHSIDVVKRSVFDVEVFQRFSDARWYAAIQENYRLTQPR